MVKTIAFSFMASILIAEVLPFVKQIKLFFDFQRLKPFDCALCLSFWIALVVTIYKGQFNFNLAFTPICSMFVMYVYQSIKFYSR